MDTRLDCRDRPGDLLPSYVDGLTSGVTNRAVEAHIESAPAVRGPPRMREPSADLRPAELDT